MSRHDSAIDSLYDLLTGEEDARVCKDIPDAACSEQPVNFFAYLTANLLNKISDELASARLILPWMLSALGAPVFFAGFLVPIREAGALLPQLAVAAYIRRMALRKGVWILGALLSGAALAAMCWVTLDLRGAAAGTAIVLLLTLFSLARGLCSVSAKDVLGKTVSKTRRGTLMGWSAGISGLAVLGIGLAMETLPRGQVDTELFAWLLGGSALLWVVAAGIFSLIREVPGSTEGGGNAMQVALQSLGMLRDDLHFRRFVTARVLLLSVALAPPFYVLLAHAGTEGSGLGWLIIASGIGSGLSSPFWGKLADRTSRGVMMLAAGLNALLGLCVWACVHWDLPWTGAPWFWSLVIVTFTLAHTGVRLGRKVYLVDMATTDNRATYVAVSNTIIGVAMLAAGGIGLLGDWLGPAYLVLLLALGSLVAAFYARFLPEVSG